MIFTEEQRAFREALQDFARRECGTREQRDALTGGGREAHNPELAKRMAELGWLGVAIPEEYGGAGGGLIEQCIFFEELFAGLIPIEGVGSTATVSGCYKRFGTDEQKRSALGAAVDGAVLAISISEPEAGSDVANVSCTARRQDGGYLLSGQKTWCSYAHLADRLLVLVRTSKEESRNAGLTMVEVPADLDGVEIRGIETMMGKEVNDVFLTDVFVEEGSVVGEPGRGFPQIMAGLDGERLICAAQGLGMARRILDDLLAYVKERKQFGKPIGSFQALRHRIADLATEIECCRLITYEVAARVEERRGERQELTRLTSMAKLKVTEVAKRAALEGMQMMGGYGYSTEYDMERHVRKALAPPIYAGTNEIQREIISGTLGLR